MELPQTQADVLRRLGQSDMPVPIGALAAALGVDQSPVTAACQALQEAGYVTIAERSFEELKLGPEAEPYARAESPEPLPERRIAGALHATGQCRTQDLPALAGLTPQQVGQTLRYLIERNWARKQGDALIVTDHGRAQTKPIDVWITAPEPLQPDERLLRALAGGRVASREELEKAGVPVAAALPLLARRKGFLTIKQRTAREVALTPAGRALLQAGVRGRRKVTQLTPELLAEGGWREVELAPYDVTLAARKLHPGKEHPFQRTLERVRRVFLELGFEEIVSPWVESSFWDFDALFQPQDHPARDMQDTFYVARPDRCRLPDEGLVQRIQATHEHGGETGSTGWQYRWSRALAQQPVLRTHTTAATIRALAAHAARRVGKWESGKVGGERGPGKDPASNLSTPPSHSEGGAGVCPPGKYFIIGPVFRRETADYKHLPVFHQVDGIIVDPHASLATLIGTLTAFYGKMGFPKVKVTPSFFPYTEPSAEVHLWLEQRREWVEMGGSGLFRPEVTLPLGIRDRVLAWGLGLERLAMMIHGLSSIGELYFATMPWLREEPMIRA